MLSPVSADSAISSVAARRSRPGREAVAAHHGSLSRELRLHAEQRLKRGEIRILIATASLELGTAISPRDAFLGTGETVPVDEAVGRISTESIAGYPPGIPALLPGELISAELVEYLKELTTAGARLHGAADPTFTTGRVLVQASS